ncbi:MAG: 16S rRNA (adenine(1518)-N(6)/adenine(1519)-N(6))-dimethyltransferase RsmA [candidate division WOR-3 bacterium]|uniref:Ribosomal RNA small subunit methyltransferase A n=1 Tax=candidate division WOR-3 bacterium TaxID=2052148 RepID=A0A7C1SJ92_UNCW3|nr:16S rRNA (adenine(1518)-N(6)/adenine(1519)-N(6))-dimethyltransferase RsmA [candidate division WOR-3 bacterium]
MPDAVSKLPECFCSPHFHPKPIEIETGEIKPIKSLGQVFLVHDKTAEQLVKALDVTDNDTVIEIGPGRGIVTSKLINVAKEVIGIEIDKRLIDYLARKFSPNNNLKLVECNFLMFDMTNYRGLKIIGNLPYYISSAILWKLLEDCWYWKVSVITVQREFAQRVLASPGSPDYGPISVVAQYLCECRRLFNIPRSYFKPTPDVVSTAVILKRRELRFSLPDFKKFIAIVNAGFSPQPRKLLVNNLALSLKISRTELVRILEQIGLPYNIRANSLSPDDFFKLASALTSISH